MTNPVWAWAIENRLSGYGLNKAFNGPRSEDVGPCWSFDRFGRSETMLPGGRLVRIGGEYEDWYDADFYIYNDVIVRHPGGRTEIFGYSEDVFPPTDFHTANLVGDRIFIVGSLSYPNMRGQNAQVLVLDTKSYAIDRFDTTAEHPPWIYKHSSELVDDGSALLVRGGLVHRPGWPAVVENIDDWRLDLDTNRWERLTKLAWPRFAFVRADGLLNHLFWLRHFSGRAPGRSERSDRLRNKILGDLGPNPRVDLLATLYSPDVSYLKVPEVADEGYIHRLSIDGVVVRYVEGRQDIQLTVEGVLPEPTVEMIRLDLLTKLAAIENTAINCIQVMVE